MNSVHHITSDVAPDLFSDDATPETAIRLLEDTEIEAVGGGLGLEIGLGFVIGAIVGVIAGLNGKDLDVKFNTSYRPTGGGGGTSTVGSPLRLN